MLHNFLRSNRAELIERCREKVVKRRAPIATPVELRFGVPLFLDQLMEMLPGGANDDSGSEPSPSDNTASAEARLEASAAQHGRELRLHNFTVEQVVHDYGDLCQAITQLAYEKKAEIPVAEFGLLNIKLDNAIATAVTEFSRRPEDGAEVGETSKDLVAIAREMRVLHAVIAVALAAMDRGLVGYAGATSRALRESSSKLGVLIVRAVHLAETAAR